MITLAAQYYFNGNDVDAEKYYLYGNNLAAMANFGKILGNKDFTASIFAMANFGRKELPDEILAAKKMPGVKKEICEAIDAMSGTSFTANAMVYYSPIKDMKFGMGPVLTFKTFDEKPTTSLKLTATLGGGKF